LIYPNANSAQQQGAAAIKQMSDGLDKIVEAIGSWAKRLEDTEHGLKRSFTELAELLGDQ